MSEAILDAAEQVALESGIETATAAAIAARAGVAVGTLYNYFPDREGILAALFRTRRAELVPAIEQAAQDTVALPFEERLRTYVRRMLEAFEAHHDFLKLAVLADGEGTKIKGRDRTLMTQVLQNLEQIMRDGASRKLYPVARAPAYARMLQGAMKGLILWRVQEGGSFVDDADLLADTFLKGLGRR